MAATSRGVKLERDGDSWSVFFESDGDWWRVGRLATEEEELEVKIRFTLGGQDPVTVFEVTSEYEPDFPSRQDAPQRANVVDLKGAKEKARPRRQ